MDCLEQRFGDVVRRGRERKSTRPEALAHQAALPRTYISMPERGQRMPSTGVVEKLATALETTMASLMKQVEESGKG